MQISAVLWTMKSGKGIFPGRNGRIFLTKRLTRRTSSRLCTDPPHRVHGMCSAREIRATRNITQRANCLRAINSQLIEDHHAKRQHATTDLSSAVSIGLEPMTHKNTRQFPRGRRIDNSRLKDIPAASKRATKKNSVERSKLPKQERHDGYANEGENHDGGDNRHRTEIIIRASYRKWALDYDEDEKAEPYITARRTRVLSNRCAAPVGNRKVVPCTKGERSTNISIMPPVKLRRQ